MSNRMIIAADIILKLENTNQTYIVGHDIPVSISKRVYAALEEKRKSLAAELGVPEVQFEFEDVIAILTGMVPIDVYKAMIPK